jgi:hypothetical protein
MANRCHVGLRTAAANQNVHLCTPGFRIQGNPIAAPVGAHLVRDALRLESKAPATALRAASRPALGTPLLRGGKKAKAKSEKYRVTRYF